MLSAIRVLNISRISQIGPINKKEAEMRIKMYHFWLAMFAIVLFSCGVGSADERDVDDAIAAATGESNEDADPPRPATIPDLTKGEPMPPPPKGDYPTWNMGQTGIIGIKNAGNEGDQVRVVAIRAGSPAEGKVLVGDVLLGVDGTKFKIGGDINWIAGNAIIKAEEEASKGLLKLDIWRDRNWLNRYGPKDAFGVDLDTLFNKAENDAEVYEWKEEEERTASVTQMGLDEFPIDGVFTNITIQLEVMGTYSDDSPWDCPVVTKARENALKVIAERMKPVSRGRQGGSWPDVLALVASGKPEYVELAKNWVHSQKNMVQDINARVPFKNGGMQSWAHGFVALETAIYYDATHDDYVLPQVRWYAIETALGQNGGGSWGHTFASPKFNGGMLHGNNPGYGAMNNAGTRCFFLLTLARKFGIEHPEIDSAIARADRFFSTFVDKGCIPYGYHSPAGSDDSNGKNYGAAYAFYNLGEKYKAKFFGMHSANAAFTRRGGHGSPTLWYYTPLCANLAGPKAVKAYMRNMRPFYTLSRCHDGSFVFLGEQSPGIGGRGMRNPTATVAMILSYPLHQLTITGKDADPNFWMTDEEYEELLISAHGMKDPELLKEMGKPWNERSTDEVIEFLDHYYPKFRGYIAEELGKRYEAGEKDIVPKLLVKLSDPEARMRAGACTALGACGDDVFLANMSKVLPLLHDEAEFVRMTSARAIGAATKPGDQTRELALLKSVVDDHPQMTMDNGNVKTAIKDIFFPGKRKSDDGVSKLLTEPFSAGYDEELVRAAMERIITMDPQGTVPITWSKETLIKLAGPVTFAASTLQVNDAMFGSKRKKEGQALLSKYGYREATDGDAYNLKRRSLLDRSMRLGVTFKDANISIARVKQAPGLYRDYLDDMYMWLQDDPVGALEEKFGRKPIIVRVETPLTLTVEIIEKDTDTKQQPSIVLDVKKMFDEKLAAVGSLDAQVKLCRSELADLDRKNFFRKNCSMDFLAEKLGAKAIDDVAPFLGHEQLWLSEHAHKVAVDLVKKGAGPRLIELYQEAQARQAGLLGNINAAGILYALADADHKPALEAARAALKHKDPVVRKAAVQVVFKIGGDPELKTVFAFIRQATEPEDYEGSERALLSKRDDPEHVKRVSQAARTLLAQSATPLRRSLAWVLGQFGGPENIAAIESAIAEPKDDADLSELVLALAYSPDRSATDVMKRLVKSDVKARAHVARLCIHRMVGAHGMRDVPDAERVSFAREILNYQYDARLVSFMGRVYTGPSMQLLYDVMKMEPEVAAKSIIEVGEGMNKPSKLDSEIATQVLADVVEYIEVTHLRGGVKAHVKEKRQAPIYMMWQGLQARAGQALLKFHKPKEKAIPQFDDTDLDI